MSNDPRKTPTYPGGIAGILAQMDGRRDPLTFADGEALPPLDTDLEALTRVYVPAPDADPFQWGKPGSSNERKLRELRKELAGRSELAVLHGLLVAHLRKSDQPPHTAALFHRLWKEQAAHLLAELNPRWQVSAITTFGDHGLTPLQRQLGLALSTLFNTMKLYESERRFSGTRADKAFSLKNRVGGPLPMDMDGFAIRHGGLDVNMIGRLWRAADEDEVLRPLAHGLLYKLIHDPRTVFRRLRQMRAEAEIQDAKKDDVIAPVETAPAIPNGDLQWGVVCTTNAPLSRIKEWAAHYLDLGAHALHIFLDTPDPTSAAFFAPYPQVTVMQCDAAHWERLGKARPEKHQRRQALNATFCLRQTPLHWLGHFDIDEFLLCSDPVTDTLAKLPAKTAAARIRPVELLCPVDGGPLQHFKRLRKRQGPNDGLLEQLYPNFGPYIPGGFASHIQGKLFARTGIAETQLDLHDFKFRHQSVTNRAELPDMKLAHCHVTDFDDFRARVDFRLSKGSYQKAGEAEKMSLSDVLVFLEESEGEAGLRIFYDEVCAARPDLLEVLSAHDLLLTQDLRLPAKVAKVFGERS